MRVLGYIIVLCLAVAALQALLGLVAVGLVLLLLWGLLFRTQQTLGLLLFGLFISIAQAHPIALVALLFILLGIKLMGAGRSN